MEINKEQIIADLKEGICNITFTKVNGDKREMRCTLKESLLPEQKDLEEEIQKKTKKPNVDVLAVFDIEAKGWRSFRWDSLTEYATGD